MQSINQLVHLPLLDKKQVTLVLKREDLLHPYISGNKYRKLKYNLLEAGKQNKSTLLTFGGAYSNHIAATAYAANEKGFKSIGVIRGEELQNSWQGNNTLRLAHEHGMEFKFVSRQAYRLKDDLEFLSQLSQEYKGFYLVPEGGTNYLAVKGCAEILTQEDMGFDVICCSVGTGGTVAGIIKSAGDHQQVLGFSALKGDFLKKEIQGMVQGQNWNVMTDYHFGGYAKMTKELVDFINEFKEHTGIPLDPVYTGKMLFGLVNMIKHNTFAAGTKILAIHTGGLQGITGMNSVLKKKNLPLLNI
ncbi:1-aminocyclopropane-1-carboxylate deaminase [Maribacter sedimenticola]|uniref:1-aminocyclopropane-1-carboxylate deaminase n=1 Tax=Maribacter sedimenticola TaxID=228956 RepID=A0ABY1SLG3_9FLAO|nr:pyridoxal-phosphate dependent enzyme [Maribacter sedimenticola]SNR75558.1 1-aminocyclopropane-1-carboxylate deaminase [Maribacter sedimenticola]